MGVRQRRQRRCCGEGGSFRGYSGGSVEVVRFGRSQCSELVSIYDIASSHTILLTQQTGSIAQFSCDTTHLSLPRLTQAHSLACTASQTAPSPGPLATPSYPSRVGFSDKA